MFEYSYGDPEKATIELAIWKSVLRRSLGERAFSALERAVSEELRNETRAEV